MKRAVFAFLASTLIASVAWACSCRPPSPDESEGAVIKRMIKESDAAFRGRVLSSRRTDPDINSGEVIARVRILKAYKGVRRGRTVTLTTGPNGAMCGLSLDKGSTIRVAASRRRDGTYSAGLCSQF
jgi:hypothetical protein